MSLLSSSLSLYSIPLVWFVGLYPAVLRAGLINKAIGFNNVAPRGNLARLKDEKVDPEIVAKAARMDAAHSNGQENFAVWVAAILVGHYAKLDNYVLNTAAILQCATELFTFNLTILRHGIVLRVAYNYVYIHQTTKMQATLRTLIWNLALIPSIYLMFSAANTVRKLS